MADTNTSPLMGTDAPDMPLGAPVPLPSLPPPSSPGLDPSAAPAAPPPSKAGPWTAMLQGALAGLAGVGNVHGRGGFGAGAGAGAASELNQRQIQVENQQRQQQINQRQQQLQYESVQAADSHIAALDQHHRADQLSDQAKLDYTAKSADYQAFLQDHFGIAPDLSFNDSHNEATAGLTTTANSNGGKIPPVATVQQPSPSGQHGKIAAYSPSQQQFNQNMSGYRNLINTSRAVQGMPPIDDASFNSMGFKGARDQALGAIEFLKPTPTFSLDKNSPTYLPTVLAQKQQQLQQYQDHKDANGKPDADPGVVKQLQGGISYLQKSWDSTNKMESDQAAKVAGASAQGKLDVENTPTQLAHEAEKASVLETARLKAKAASAAYTPGNMVAGSMPDGSQVAGTVDELQRAGATGVSKLDADTGKKVIVSRQLIAPDGLFSSVNADIRKLDQEGKLGVLASRWNDFMAGKVGSEPDFAALRTHMGLLSTALMQAHVGARGSEEMLKHFEQLADYKISDAATLRSALGAEYGYVKEKAMLPKKPLAAPAATPGQGQ